MGHGDKEGAQGQGGAGQGASLLSRLTVHQPSQAALLVHSACRWSWGQGPRTCLPPRPAICWWELLGGWVLFLLSVSCLHMGHQGWRG